MGVDAGWGRERGAMRQGGTGGGPNVKLPLQRPAKSLNYMENTSRLQGNRTTSEFLQTKIALMSGYDLSVLWPSSLSACLSHSNSHTKTKLMFEPKQPPRTTSFTAKKKKKKSTQKFNNCVELSVFIIPSPLSDGDDLLVTNRVDLNRGPFGEPFHHLNSTSSNSHDLMRCRMPENLLVFSLLSLNPFSSTAAGIHNRKK